MSFLQGLATAADRLLLPPLSNDSMHTQIAGLAEAWGCYLQVSSRDRKKGRMWI